MFEAGCENRVLFSFSPSRPISETLRRLPWDNLADAVAPRGHEERIFIMANDLRFERLVKLRVHN